MKTLLTSLLLIILLAKRGVAQHPNPFESIGKKANIVTAYGKNFDETFDNDSIQRIGSVLVNIYSKKVVRLLNTKEVFSKFSDNSSSSRWMSIDPHAEKYANMSPYAAMGNNPLLIIDPDGRDLVITGTKQMQDQYAKLLAQTTGYNMSIDNKTGKLTVGEAIAGAKNTSSILASLVSTVAGAKDVYTFGLTGDKGDDDQVWIDSYEKGLVDVADLGKIGEKGGNALLAGALGHFIAEVSATKNYADEGGRKGKFDKAHEIGLAKEGEIVGSMIGTGTSPRITGPVSVNEKEKLYRYSFGGKSYILGAGVISNQTTEEIRYIQGFPIKVYTTTTKTNGLLTNVYPE